jgi:hypothetical protein
MEIYLNVVEWGRLCTARKLLPGITFTSRQKR